MKKTLNRKEIEALMDSAGKKPGQGFDVAQVDADALLELIEILRAKDRLLDDD